MANNSSSHLLPLSLLSLFLFFSFFKQPTQTTALPPASPIHCDASGCVLSNAYGLWNDRDTDCRAGSVLYPTTEGEIVDAVAEASEHNKNVKVVSGFSHTIPPLACPPTPDSLLISTARFNREIEINVTEKTVTIDSGVGLRDLINKVEAVGLSLVAAPYWEGVSIGGLLSTGSHGSSWWGRGGSVHDHVGAINLVIPADQTEGYAKVLRLSRGDELFNAALVSVGLLGVISKVTLELEPRFKRSITYNFQDDTTLEKDFVAHAQDHEFADITWYPSKHTSVYRLDNRVPLNSSGDGINDFLGFQSNLVAISTGVRSEEKTLEKLRNTNGKCVLASTDMTYKKLIGNGLKNGGSLFTGYPVIGYQGKMQTSGSCLHSSIANPLSMCSWDPRIKGLSFFETTAIFPLSQFENFILDVKRLRDLNPKNFCGIDVYNGFLIRFIKKSDAYLGQDEDSVVVDFNYLRADEASTPRLNQDVMDEIEQMAFVKFNAKPHWGKNRRIAFAGIESKYVNWNRFMKVKTQVDPKGMFNSSWLEKAMNGVDGEDGCGLEGQCTCSEDRHCSPSQGFLCKPGLVYEQAKVCRYSG